MIDNKQYFKGKKITVMGLGLLGGALNDTKFLAEHGAELTVTDLKTAEQLKSSLDVLQSFNNPSEGRAGIKYVLGGHKLEDFQNADMILQPGNVPTSSPFLAEARKNNIPVFVSESLFAKYAEGVVIVGVTGTRGKTTTTHLLYKILKADGRKVFLGGNIQNISTLNLLDTVKAGDTVVMELDSWALHGMGEIKKSPHVSIFTNFLKDHLNFYMNGGIGEEVALKDYFTDKAQIFLNQRSSDYIIATEQVIKKIEELKPKGKLVVAREVSIPKLWKPKLIGDHNRLNIACAIEAAKALGVNENIIGKVVSDFGGVEGRMQYIRTINDIDVYNDTCATTPDATIAALRALGVNSKRNIVLIIGGDDKKLDMSALIKEIPLWCSKVVLFKERGTDKIRDQVIAMKEEGIEVYEEEGLLATVNRAIEIAKSGEIILYSPAFSSFGKYFKNEYDRGDKFNELLRNLG
ncbi:MAG: UDP-N-acetylmuramoyl-L-alanine--D-glutamate ligase [Candidatus Paceibacterota bacterium]